jgi:hypothetical protein
MNSEEYNECKDSTNDIQYYRTLTPLLRNTVNNSKEYGDLCNNIKCNCINHDQNIFGASRIVNFILNENIDSNNYYGCTFHNIFVQTITPYKKLVNLFGDSTQRDKIFKFMINNLPRHDIFMVATAINQFINIDIINKYLQGMNPYINNLLKINQSIVCILSPLLKCLYRATKNYNLPNIKLYENDDTFIDIVQLSINIDACEFLNICDKSIVKSDFDILRLINTNKIRSDNLTSLLFHRYEIMMSIQKYSLVNYMSSYYIHEYIIRSETYYLHINNITHDDGSATALTFENNNKYIEFSKQMLIPCFQSNNNKLSEENINTNKCSICLENLNINCVKISCKHEFHIECINTWCTTLANRQHTCPDCREVFILDNDKTINDIKLFNRLYLYNKK